MDPTVFLHGSLHTDFDECSVGMCVILFHFAYVYTDVRVAFDME